MKKRFILLVAAILITLAGSVGTYATLSYFRPFQVTAEDCSTKDGIEICLLANTLSVTSRDTIEYTITLRNLTEKPYTKTFNSTCTDPVIVNKADPYSGIGGACGMVITDHTLNPLQRQTFTIRSSGSNYKTGKNTVYATWAGHKSPSKNITKKISDQSDTDRQFKECQSIPDNASFDATPDYCEFITVTLNDAPADCQKFKDLLASLDLAIPCDEVMDTGIGYVYVPADDTTDWASKIQSLPGVESAS